MPFLEKRYQFLGENFQFIFSICYYYSMYMLKRERKNKKIFSLIFIHFQTKYSFNFIFSLFSSLFCSMCTLNKMEFIQFRYITLMCYENALEELVLLLNFYFRNEVEDSLKHYS